MLHYSTTEAYFFILHILCSLAGQTALFFYIGEGTKGLIKWPVVVGDATLCGFILAR